MKKEGKFFAVMLGLLVLAATPFSLADEKKKTVMTPAVAYQKGLEAYKSGNLQSAKVYFTTVLKQVPNHVQSRRHLALIKKAELDYARKPAIEKKLDLIILPKVEMEDTALEDAVDYIRRKTKEVAKDKSPNFVLRVPDEKAEEAVNMKLERVPVSELLRYLASISGTRVVYEPHAVVITTRTQSSSAKSAPVRRTGKEVPFSPKPVSDPFSR